MDDRRVPRPLPPEDPRADLWLAAKNVLSCWDPLDIGKPVTPGLSSALYRLYRATWGKSLEETMPEHQRDTTNVPDVTHLQVQIWTLTGEIIDMRRKLQDLKYNEQQLRQAAVQTLEFLDRGLSPSDMTFVRTNLRMAIEATEGL